MKKIAASLLFICCALAAFAQDMNVMTFNIRFNNPGDSLNAWPYRKDKVASQIAFHDVHVLGVQEALIGQINDIKLSLPKFKAIGLGRDGGDKGEHSSVLYDTTRLTALGSETFWLSLTPEVPASKSWDAALTRIVTWAKFKDLKTGKLFFFFNTHFDHVGKEARRESAKFLLQRVASISGNTPAIISGDFNAVPSDEPIQVIVDESNPLHLKDAKALSASLHYGPSGTFNGFKTSEEKDVPIDYIFLKGSWKVKKHATLSEAWHGRYASDHYAVVATVSQ